VHAVRQREAARRGREGELRAYLLNACMHRRMTVSAIRYIGGFGEMSWVPTQDYLAAPVDPVGEPLQSERGGIEY
jgi:hypothetical protein